MKLVSISIQNFMAISTANVKLADRGLILIQGVNQDESSADSNGAGKSSVADSLAFVLFGTTARGEEGDRVVNRLVGKDCHVKLQVEDGDDFYCIQRFRKHKTHKNALMVEHAKRDEGKWTDLTKGTEKLTQELVNQIIGCSYEVFIGAIYCGQGEMPDLPGMTDKALKMLIEEASGATLLETAYVEANTRLRTKKSEADVVDGLLDRSRSELKVIQDKLVDFQAGKDTFELERIASIRDTHAQALVVKESLVAAKAAAAADDISLLRTGIDGFDRAIAAVEAERKRETELAANLETAKRRVLALELAAKTAETTLKRANDGLAATAHKVGCPCSTCARPFTAADIVPATKIAEEQVRVATVELDTAKSLCGPAQKLVLSVADALKKHRATMTDVSETNAQRGALQLQLTAAIARGAAVTAQAETLKRYVAQITAKKAEINPFIHRIETAKIALRAAEADIVAREADLATATAALKVAEAVAKVFSPAGVRAFLLDEVTPFLNDQTAKYLGGLSDGHITATWTTLIKTGKGELREKFSIEVTNSTGGETFRGISGGEKRKVRIACALALQDLVARRATKPIEIFIADEVDDALDAAGLERLADVLKEKASERGSVFVISHSDIKDWFANVITVTKKDGVSTIDDGVMA